MEKVRGQKESKGRIHGKRKVKAEWANRVTVKGKIER